MKSFATCSNGHRLKKGDFDRLHVIDKCPRRSCDGYIDTVNVEWKE